MAREHNTKRGVHVLQSDHDFSKLNDLQMMADQAYDLGAVNSVNPGRIIAQTAYNFSVYLKTIAEAGKEIGDPVDITIQSGNMGNALSAIYARKMGLPYRNIIMATNENDTIYSMIEHGVYLNQKGPKTDSSAQDVNNPSNAWRYFGTLYGNDPEKVARVFKLWKETGRAAIKDIGIEDTSVWENLMAARVTADERTAITRQVFYGTNRRVIIDPHTANGLAAIEKLKAAGRLDDDVPMVAVETARAYKFDRITHERIGWTMGRPTRYIDFEAAQRGKRLPKISTAEDLLSYIALNTNARKRK
jgi:threonine synthase